MKPISITLALILLIVCVAAEPASAPSEGRERVYVRRGVPFTEEYDYTLEEEPEDTEDYAFVYVPRECPVAVTEAPQSVEDDTGEDIPPETVSLSSEDERAAEYIAKTLYGECRACSPTEQSAVVWCVLNRVDSDARYFPDDIISVVTQQNQFLGYSAENPVREDLLAMARDVLIRWRAESAGEIDVGRTLPREYCFFWGDMKHNHFTVEWKGTEYWDWSLTSPYES